jgi:hypothetical protein
MLMGKTDPTSIKTYDWVLMLMGENYPSSIKISKPGY